MIPGLKAVVFDWAGTMIDFGSRAPVVALCKVFAAHGVPIEEHEARADMGMAKRDHIAAILRQPRVHAAWLSARGADPDAAAIDGVFEAIAPMMLEAANDCAQLIPGAAQVVADLRTAGVKIGSCTGYSREMMAGILPAALEQGYAPDVVVCAGETAAGRPSPLMLWKNLVELGAWPATACVKVDDAAVGIAEGLAAGVWTIGIAASGNSVGLSQPDLDALAPDERAARIAAARQVLEDAGAHLVIDTVADLPGALAQLDLG